MKNTMKKLLCMALAIMLLVSAVPVFAAADGFTVTFKNPTGKVVGTHSFPGDANWTNVGAAEWARDQAIAAGALNGKYNQSASVLDADNNIVQVSKAAETVNVTFKTPDGSTVKTWSYSDEIGEPDWGGGAASWAMGEAGLSYDHAEVQDASNPYNATIKVWNDAQPEPEKEVVVTFKTPSGDVTWSYKPSTYATESNNGGAPSWTADAAAWAMNEAVKAGKLSKKFDNVQLISVGPDSYTATIKVSDNQTSTEPTTPTTSGDLSLVITANGAEVVKKTIQNFTKSTVSNLIKNYLDADWTSKYGFNEVAVGGVTYYRSDVEVKATDKTVNISLSRKYSKDNSNKVYLHVYLNGDASTIALTKDITGTYLMDDWSTDTTEILKYLKNNYYTAKDTSNAITIDGLYTNTNTNGAFPGNYYADKKVSRLDNIKDALEDGYVHISVMLKNAKAKSSSTADSSNPKTGDTIYVPMVVMGLTGTAAAAAYVFGKKRFAR